MTFQVLASVVFAIGFWTSLFIPFTTFSVNTRPVLRSPIPHILFTGLIRFTPHD